MSIKDRCSRCGGRLINDDDEIKCFMCGRSGASVLLGEEARREVEASDKFEWEDYVAGRSETASARLGANTTSDIAEYKRRYHLAHREKDLADMLSWKGANGSRLKEWRRKFGMSIAVGICKVCGLTIHFSRKCGWRHSRKDRAFHLAKVK